MAFQQQSPGIQMFCMSHWTSARRCQLPVTHYRVLEACLTGKRSDYSLCVINSLRSVGCEVV